MTANGHENGDGDRVTATSHDDLPGEKGTANVRAGTSIGRKTETGHGESGPDETGSGPKTATGRDGKTGGSERDKTVHGQKATEMSPAYHTLDLLTVSWKRSESASDETGHRSDPTGSGLYDPSVFLGPKTGKHGRNENGSGLPKTLPTHHLAERAVMSGESRPKTGRSAQGTAASEPLLDPQPPKGQRRQKRTHAHRQSHQRYFHPSRSQHGEREERKHHGKQHKVHPETPPSHPALLKGGRKKKKEPQGA